MTPAHHPAQDALPDALVELRAVHFGYGEREGLSGVSLVVPRG